MKNKLQYFFAFTMMIALLLGSCFPVLTQSPNVAVTFAKHPEAERVGEATVTLPPTETPTPTEDPLAGAPEGTTGKDPKTGQWIKTEMVDGVERAYVWMSEELTMLGGETMQLEGWFEPRTRETKNAEPGSPVYIIRPEAHGYFPITNKIIPMRVFKQEGLAPLGSDDAVIFNNVITTLTDQGKLFSFDGILVSDLLHRVKKQFGTPIKFSEAINKGEVPIPTDGLPDWYPGPKVGYTVIILDANTEINGTKISENPLFEKWKAMWGSYFYSMATMDADGNLVQIVSSEQSLDTLDDKHVRVMLLFSFLRVVRSPDLNMSLDGIATLMERYINRAGLSTKGDDSIPFLEVSPAP